MKLHILTAGTVLLVLGLPTGARADLDRMSKMRLDQAKQVAARLTISRELRHSRSPANKDAVAKAHNDTQNLLSQIDRLIKRIPRRNHDKPEVVKFKNGLAKYRAYVKDLEAVIAHHKKLGEAAEEAARKSAKLVGKFYDAYWHHNGVMTLFVEVYEKPDTYLRYGAKQLTEARTAFKEINTGCTGSFKAIETATYGRGPRFALWCKVAAQGPTLIKRVVVNKFKTEIDEVRASFATQLKNLAGSNGNLRDWDMAYYYDPAKVKARYRKRFASDFAAIGAQMPADAFAPADKALAELLVKVQAHAPKWRYEPKGKKTRDRFVASAYKKAYKGVKVRAIHMHMAKWGVRKNARGVPTHRFKKGELLYQLKGENWCRHDQFAYIQDYKRRRYGKTYFEHARKTIRPRIVSCK